MQLVYIRGKRGRQVPVLLTLDVVEPINLLIETRKMVGVSDRNIYLFPAPTRGSLNPLRGYQCMAELIKHVDTLQMPDLIKSTKLRKYVATVAQIIDLERNELEWLANHLGHNLDVHKQYYRLSDSAVELAKVSRLLMAVDAGKGKELLGKKLDEINLNGKVNFEDFEVVQLTPICISNFKTVKWFSK